MLTNCSVYDIQWPHLPNAEMRRMEAGYENTGFKIVPAGVFSNHETVITTGTPYCNVTLSYETKPFPGINTTVQILLPSKPNGWNGRLQALGGSGWSAGLSDYSGLTMSGAVAEGFVAIATDSGWPTNNPYDYALLKNNQTNATEVDWRGLEHYASTSLEDLASLGKQITKEFYGKSPKWSYWNGCSQGGRQGMMIAQKYPKAYDGIAASAAPVNWGPLMVAGFWVCVPPCLGDY
jgi:hypothetical protein